MLKKIALLIMLVLPMGVFAQSTLKFGHMNSTDIIPTMPEYTKAISELQALEKNYTDEIQRTQAEFTKKISGIPASNSKRFSTAKHCRKKTERIAGYG